MNIDVEAYWDETGNNINVTTKVEPCMTPDAGNTYAIGYVLTASGLKMTNGCNKPTIATT